MVQTKQDLLDQLQALKIFPKTRLVKELRNQIKKKLEKIEQKPILKQRQSNQSRSGKLRRYHNYIRQIQNNFPNLKYNQIRTQLAQRREGKQVSIPDVIWQNPSP